MYRRDGGCRAIICCTYRTQAVVTFRIHTSHFKFLRKWLCMQCHATSASDVWYYKFVCTLLMKLKPLILLIELKCTCANCQITTV